MSGPVIFWLLLLLSFNRPTGGTDDELSVPPPRPVRALDDGTPIPGRPCLSAPHAVAALR